MVILDTPEILRQLRRNLASPQSSVVIVTPFLQDVDIAPARSLMTFFEAQVSSGAEIRLFTTPPSIARASEFRRKYNLLEALSVRGVAIFLNEQLHAKVFCFNLDGMLFNTILGSANLTSAALSQRLELAVFSARDSFYHSAMARIHIFIRRPETEDFLSWKSRRFPDIRRLVGGVVT